MVSIIHERHAELYGESANRPDIYNILTLILYFLKHDTSFVHPNESPNGKCVVVFSTMGFWRISSQLFDRFSWRVIFAWDVKCAVNWSCWKWINLWCVKIALQKVGLKPRPCHRTWVWHVLSKWISNLPFHFHRFLTRSECDSDNTRRILYFGFRRKLIDANRNKLESNIL